MTEAIHEKQEEKVQPGSTNRLIRQIKRATYRRYTSEEKIRIVLEGFRKEIPISELCRRESIHVSQYYKWLKDFMEGGKARLKCDTQRNANKDEVENLKRENEKLKTLVGEQTLELQLLKKSVL